ncbi:hypothetical protein TNCV_359111 [Trichonephila clavipes]|nr:hypothetical protein TNCV_359111 [Trichonephila clavipes]
MNNVRFYSPNRIGIYTDTTKETVEYNGHNCGGTAMAQSKLSEKTLKTIFSTSFQQTTEDVGLWTSGVWTPNRIRPRTKTSSVGTRHADKVTDLPISSVCFSGWKKASSFQHSETNDGMDLPSGVTHSSI